MNASPFKSQAPSSSRIASHLPGASFHDAWAVPAGDPRLSALGQFLKAFAATPRWVNACMSLRNRLGSVVGLKDLGAFDALDPARPAADYRSGERVGIFTLIENGFDEALLGDQDRHLDVTLSLHRAVAADSGAVVVTVTTVVHVHNLLGRLYMLPVAPMHRIIAPAVLRAVAAAPDAA